jgi:hypothetical protein
VQSIKRNVDLYVAVDGGMSDNLRPMLYGARYEAQIASRFGGGTYCHLVGKHCESGDLIVATPSSPTPGGRRRRHARDGAYGFAMANTYNGVRARRSSSSRTATRAWRPPRDLRGPWRGRRACLSPSASACSATAPSASAFAELLEARAARSRRHRPAARAARRADALARRLRGDPRASDLVVELMGGLDPARDYVLRAMAAGQHVVTANKQLLSQHGEELWAARASTACSCASRPRWPASCRHPRAAGVAGRRPRRPPARDRQRDDELHPHAHGRDRRVLRRRAGRGPALGYAEADPTEDVNGKDAAAKMAILARLAFNTPVHLDQVRYEGIEHITADDMEYARELGLGLKLIGTAERVDGGLSVRVHPAFLYGGHRWPASTARSTR